MQPMVPERDGDGQDEDDGTGYNEFEDLQETNEFQEARKEARATRNMSAQESRSSTSNQRTSNIRDTQDAGSSSRASGGYGGGVAEIPEEIQQAVFEHPKVQEAIRKSEKARTAPLSDPAVQQQILSVCYEKHPEVAEVAPAAISAWGKDPETTRKAQDAAGVQGVPALANVARLFVGPNRAVEVINQGSPTVRILAFVGGVGCIVMSVLPCINPVELFMHPVMWVIHTYQLLFAFSTLIFEAKPEWVRWLKMIDNYKALLIENGKFLAKALGRGLFYIFQGTLWLVLGYSAPAPTTGEKPPSGLAKFYHFLSLVLGLYMCLIGGAHVLMHWGVMPSNYALTLNNAGGHANERVQSALSSLRERRAAESGTSVPGGEVRQVEMSSRSGNV